MDESKQLLALLDESQRISNKLMELDDDNNNLRIAQFLNAEPDDSPWELDCNWLQQLRHERSRMCKLIKETSIDNPQVQEIFYSINNIISERIELTEEAANQDTRGEFVNTLSTKNCCEDLMRNILSLSRNVQLKQMYNEAAVLEREKVEAMEARLYNATLCIQCMTRMHQARAKQARMLEVQKPAVSLVDVQYTLVLAPITDTTSIFDAALRWLLTVTVDDDMTEASLVYVNTIGGRTDKMENMLQRMAVMNSGLAKQSLLLEASLANGRVPPMSNKEPHGNGGRADSGLGDSVRGECVCGGSSDVALLLVGSDYFKRRRKKLESMFLACEKLRLILQPA